MYEVPAPRIHVYTQYASRPYNYLGWPEKYTEHERGDHEAAFGGQGRLGIGGGMWVSQTLNIVPTAKACGGKCLWASPAGSKECVRVDGRIGLNPDAFRDTWHFPQI